MKKKYIIKAFSVLFAFTAMLSGCSKNEYREFDANYASLAIWFGTEYVPQDSITYNYSYALGEKTVHFYARTIGALSDHDRSFQLEAFDGDLDEAQGSYSLGEYTIKAGESIAQFDITFDTSKLKDALAFTQKDGHLKLRMKANDEFSTGVKELQTLTIVLKNYLSKPDNWDAAQYPLRPLSAYFGEYSKVKYQFMIQELNLVDFNISYNASISYDEETNTLSHNYANYLVSKMKLALEEYNASHDTPLTDETGNIVTF